MAKQAANGSILISLEDDSMGVQAKDGSLRVTVTDGETAGGAYAPDGSMRVSLAEDSAAIVPDGFELEIGGTTYTFTVTNGVITNLVAT